MLNNTNSKLCTVVHLQGSWQKAKIESKKCVPTKKSENEEECTVTTQITQ